MAIWHFIYDGEGHEGYIKATHSRQDAISKFKRTKGYFRPPNGFKIEKTSFKNLSEIPADNTLEVIK